MFLGVNKFANKHSGKKCFVIGAGPSLKDVDTSVISNYPVICVNSSILKFDWTIPDDSEKRFWLSCDSLCMEWDYFWKKVIHSDCVRIVRDSWSRKKDKFQDAGRCAKDYITQQK